MTAKSNTPVKILFVTTTAQMAGAEKMLFLLASHLDRDRFDVRVCILGAAGELSQRLKGERVEVVALGIESKWHFYKALRLLFLLWSFHPTIVQSFLFFDNILVRVAGRISFVPVVISGQRNVHASHSRLRNTIDRVTLPLAHYCVSNTQAGKELLVEKFGYPARRIEVIHNCVLPWEGLEQEEARRELLGEQASRIAQRTVLGFVGFMSEQKGIPFLLSALHGLSDCALILIGDGPERAAMEQRVAEGGLGERVFFVGHRENAAQYMRAFDIFILPSLWEGMPNVLLEALNAGVPAVATKVGGVEEVIRDEGVGCIIPPKSADDIVKAVQLLQAQTEEEMRRRALAQRQLIQENFSVQSMVHRFEVFYQALLSPTRRI